MPIVVNNAGDAAKAGIVIGSFYIGQMLSPLIGAITDRTGWHRPFYLSGYVLLALGLALFPFAQLVWFWVALAFIQGVGSGTSNTVAAMFIVEYKPKQEWDARVGWLQTFYGIGQAAGLGLAAVLQARPELGLLISAGLMVPGILLGSRELPPQYKNQKPDKAEFSRRWHRPPRTVVSILHQYEGAFLNNLKHSLHEWRSRFGVYIAGWFFVMLSTWLIGALFPLLMKSAFNLSYGMSALYYAIGAVIGIFVYTPSGTLGKKIGDGWVVIIGTIMTLVSLASLTTLSYVHSGFNQWLVPVMYILIPIAWSPLIVGGTAWTAQLTPFKEGEALGSFNAATAVAAVIAAFAAGFVAHKFGYGMILVIATITSVIALLCFIPLVFTVNKD
jgi:MFS family permease